MGFGIGPNPKLTFIHKMGNNNSSMNELNNKKNNNK